MDDIDLLQIKIEKAKSELPEDTQNAINAVDWKAVIMEMRQKKGYSFEQLGDLELETELLLCGLLDPRDYPRELENRMEISRREADELVGDMNKLVFTKIREELIRNTERKKIFEGKKKPEVKNGATVAGWPLMNKGETHVLNEAGIDILPSPVPADTSKKTDPLGQKFSTVVQNQMVKTEHSPENLTPAKNAGSPLGTDEKNLAPAYPNGTDPYRLPPE